MMQWKSLESTIPRMPPCVCKKLWPPGCSWIMTGRKYSRPSWQKIAEAVMHFNMDLFKNIAKKHGMKNVCILSLNIVRFDDCTLLTRIIIHLGKV